jgi:hypothetical protein
MQIRLNAEEAFALLSFLYDRKEELYRLKYANDKPAKEALPDTMAEEPL